MATVAAKCLPGPWSQPWPRVLGAGCPWDDPTMVGFPDGAEGAAPLAGRCGSVFQKLQPGVRIPDSMPPTPLLLQILGVVLVS